jgi:hypothetical protein
VRIRVKVVPGLQLNDVGIQRIKLGGKEAAI